MPKPVLTIFVWAMLAGPALASDRPVDLLSQGDPSIGADGTVTTGDPCDSITAYEPVSDVAYQPGVDVDGNPVAPADLDGGSGSILGPDHEYSVDVALPLSDVTDTTHGSGAERVADSDVNIGKVTVRDGKVYFNGQLISDERAHALAEACAKRQAAPAE